MLTVEQILAGTTTGRMQSVGQMSVIPLLDGGDAQDETFGEPTFRAGTRSYGSVSVQNAGDRPTIAPTGAAWLTEENAQDHAVPGASLLKAGESRDLKGYCVQQAQPGLMQQREREFTLLPAPLRAPALANRNGGSYNALWSHISEFRAAVGDPGIGNLVDFLKRFEKELDQFVAEFENVPRQIGALVLIGGKVVGIERAPNVAYWRTIWTPLIRVCYGGLAIKVGKTNRSLPSSRVPLAKAFSLDGLRAALATSRAAADQIASKAVEVVGAKMLTDQAEGSRLDEARVLTVASQEYAGQVVQNGARPVYASICAAA